MARTALATTEEHGEDSLLRPLPLNAVRLLKSEFRDGAEINQGYLESLSTDRLLHMFRLTAGISSKAEPLGGWEEPTCELRGHFAGGHYLSAAALAYATAGNDTLRDRGNAMVSALAACQKANGNGYLSAYPASFFERLARGEPVWAPFYTQHKILAGLIDMYVHTGNEEALQVAENMSGWVLSYFAGISDDQRQRMLRTEYGGMNEALVNLYALTGRERHLAAARLFEQPSFLDPLALRRDELQGLHANTNVPKVIGAARSYEVTGDPRYRGIADYFLEEVLAARNYVIGNTSEDEHWTTRAGDLAGTLSLTNAECCVAYNMMKLERHVFGWSGEARWMDAYERSLFNCRLGTQNGEGFKQYFFPLAAGYWRVYNSPEDSFWCCTGTGAEEFAKFTDTIYFTGRGGLWVNQFIASTAEWKDAGLSLRQETAFPAEQATTLVITAAPVEKKTICLRIPGWLAQGGSVEVNGRPLEAFAEPGSYLALERVWRAGDRVKLNLPMQLTTEPLSGAQATQAVLYGPLVLAADLGDGPSSGPTKILHGRGTTPKGVGAPLANPVVHAGHSAGTRAEWVDCVSASDLSFRTAGVNGVRSVMPMYRIKDQRYAVYWDMTT
ncbi:MAG TPA: beta-L-arabinofuranosidase domain-containing protein [Candidatus Aquilonibacter sp.]|nr:beta-L-arabinofuranosidase domain-containing protein [Candidatus Aquilonibacter sp.]